VSNLTNLQNTTVLVVLFERNLPLIVWAAVPEPLEVNCLLAELLTGNKLDERRVN
jgi:hypothetical protein